MRYEVDKEAAKCTVDEAQVSTWSKRYRVSSTCHGIFVCLYVTHMHCVNTRLKLRHHSITPGLLFLGNNIAPMGSTSTKSPNRSSSADDFTAATQRMNFNQVKLGFIYALSKRSLLSCADLLLQHKYKRYTVLTMLWLDGTQSHLLTCQYIQTYQNLVTVK